MAWNAEIVVMITDSLEPYKCDLIPMKIHFGKTYPNGKLTDIVGDILEYQEAHYEVQLPGIGWDF